MTQDTPKVESGIIAFLDILGYANFLENNEPEEAAKVILNILLTAPDKMRALNVKIYNEDIEIKTHVEEQLKRFKWLIFSDSILVAFPYTRTATDDTKAHEWMYFLLFISTLYRHLFDNGLPIRGAVTFGNFFIKGQCFAGRTIINAYKMASTLDLAAIALDKQASDELLGLMKKSNMNTAMECVTEYAIPLKDGTSPKRLVVIPSFPLMPTLTVDDLRQVVAESFWKHKKDLTPSVMTKLNNTEMFFRYFKMKSPILFIEK